MKPPPDVEFAAFAGIDWSDTKHDICLQAANSEERELAVVPHRPAAIDAWASALRRRFGGRPVAVCLELAKGPLVYALQKYDFLVLFPVHPATLAKYREAFVPSHAKAESPHCAKRSHAHAAAAGRAAPPTGGRPEPHQQPLD
jgi:Transposase